MPKHPVINGVRIYPCGREVCLDTAAGSREYKRRLQHMVDRQLNRCCLCGQIMLSNPTFEHQISRGAGGFKRDDRTYIDGKPHNGASHGRCNMFRGSTQSPLLYR